NQNQSQEQRQMIEFQVIVDTVKDELTGKQLNELKAILQDNKIEKKNEKIAEKLLSFGANVASGILGNILSNPQIFGLF
ncbi:MAG: peptide chain release factor 1, partial [Paludibacter sp.]